MSARWSSWRRDLLFALAGALVASAVLVPVGWWQVRAERQRAEAAEAEAARNQAVAEDQARTTHQEDEHAAEREKAQRDLDEQYRALLAEYTEDDVKAAIIPPGPRDPELGSQPKPSLEDESVRKILEAERRERKPK
jgi:hypothetical protein